MRMAFWWAQCTSYGGTHVSEDYTTTCMHIAVSCSTTPYSSAISQHSSVMGLLIHLQFFCSVVFSRDNSSCIPGPAGIALWPDR